MSEDKNYEVSTSVIKPEHINLKEEFVSRAKNLIGMSKDIEGYSVKNDRWSEVEEAQLRVGDFVINLKVTKSK